MKKYLFTAALVILLCVQSFAQDDRYRGFITLNNGVLREVNDSISLSIDIRIDSRAIDPNTGMRFVPVIVAGNHSLEMPDLLVQGRNKSKSNERSKRILSKKGRNEFHAPFQIFTLEEGESTSFHYTYSAPYDLWMDQGRLVIFQEIINPRDIRSFVAMSFDNKVQLSPRIPYVVVPKANMVIPAAEKKVRNRQGQAFLDFQSGKSVILPNYRRNPQELAKIDDAFSYIINDADVQINGLFIEGYASPEGRYETNERLSKGRAMALKDYIMKNFRLPLSESQIKVSWMAEDWDGLVTQVKMSEMEYKDQVLSVIESTDVMDGREGALMRLANGRPYKYMLSEMFPQLRRVEYQIDYSVRDYTGDEIKTKTEKDYPYLSQRELYILATSGDESIDSDKILLSVIPSMYQNVATAVNASAVLIERGEYVTARKMLEPLAQHPEVWNNLGVIYMMEGELEKAEGLLQKAIESNVDQASHNLEELTQKRIDNARMERYKTRAIQSLK